MRTFVMVCAAALLFARAAAADSPKLTLEQTIAKTLAGPRARMAAGEADNARAQLAEAKALRLPRIKATVFGAPSPDIDCLDANCTRTDPINFAFRYEGLWGGGELDVSQPIVRFGASHGFSAAKAGVEAKRLLADEAAGDLAVEAARAYWGLKLARELGYMLDDGIEQIQKAIARMEERTGKDAPSPQDRNRIALLLAEAEVQRADAVAGERQALAGLRALTGVPDADVDDEPLEAVEFALPKEVTGSGRPQARAAREGARAADELVEFTSGSYFPQISIAGRAWIAGAQGADDPPSIYAYDPYNRWGAELALVSTWTAEPWTVHAKVERARADARRAHALADLAAAGARYDAETVLGEAIAARTKLDSAAKGEKAGHAWVVSLVQADVIGAVESKEFADAYIAWFRMKANWAQAAFQWNVAITRLGRVNGDFRAKP